MGVMCGIDAVGYQATAGGSSTEQPNAVLEALMVNVGKTVSKNALAETLYTLDDDASSDAIEVYVHRLRKKMEGCAASIVTLRGLGYLLRHAGA